MPGKEVRLQRPRHQRNAWEKDAEGNITLTIFCTYDADTLTSGRWPQGQRRDPLVSAAHALPVEIRLYDRLFSVPNPGAADDFLAVINPESLVIETGVRGAEPAQAEAGKAYQFECQKAISASTAAMQPQPICSTAPSGCVIPRKAGE
ncbi:hypothetical protein MJ579_08810 [Klebsiella pneumoniae]|nr:hypothetical protein MJ579_08810 [Klebsiella pneumoniae]